MKTIGFIFLSSVLPFSTFGQQPLWSTVEDNELGIRYVPLNKVTQEVLEYYDLYERLYDLSGYNKEEFIKVMEYDSEDQEWLYDIHELTVIAMRSNTGHGSMVTVMCVSEENVNVLIFSNTSAIPFYDYQSTDSYEREKFVKWFKTLIPEAGDGVEEKVMIEEKVIGTQALYPGSASQGSKEYASGDAGDSEGTVDSRALYGKSGGGGGGPSLDLAGWRWDYEPKPKDSSIENGRIVFEIKVDDNGEVVSVKTLEKTVSPSVTKLYLREVQKLTFSPLSSNSIPAPISTGKITFIIKSE